MTIIMKLFGFLIGPIMKILPFLVVFKAGKDSVKKDILEKENEILKKQRDNDVFNVTDADDLHDRMHDKHTNDS